MAGGRGRGHAAAECGGEEENERRLHATSVEGDNPLGEPENYLYLCVSNPQERALRLRSSIEPYSSGLLLRRNAFR